MLKAVARARRQRQGGRSRRHLLQELARRFSEHEIPVYASAIAFRAIVSLIPLVLLGLALLGALGLQDTWRDSIAPGIKPHVTQPVFDAIDFSVQRIFSTSAAGVIAFASLLVIWDLTIAVTAVMRALNRVHDIDEKRPFPRRAAIAVALALAVAICVIAATLVLVAGPRPGGALHVVLGIGRWVLAPLVLGLAIGLLVRFAPAEKPETRWASAGSVVVVAVWLVASTLFQLWATHVANFKSGVGTLTGLLLLSAYVFVSSAIFLVGAELDELLRKETDGSVVALPDLFRALVSR